MSMINISLINFLEKWNWQKLAVHSWIGNKIVLLYFSKKKKKKKKKVPVDFYFFFSFSRKISIGEQGETFTRDT